jgi:membrane protease YdiL (CAAX protease family)
VPDPHPTEITKPLYSGDQTVSFCSRVSSVSTRPRVGRQVGSRRGNFSRPGSSNSMTTMPDLYRFFALACGITWLLDLPLALAWATNTPPPSYALTMTGLGAWGPTIAAFVVAARRHALRGVFGRWRARPVWIVVALLLPLAVQLPATCIEAALGGQPTHWFYPPLRPEHFAALVMFPLGEEFGWRGFAYPRLAQRWGPVVGSLVLGAGWGLWHLGMLFAPDPLRRLPAVTIVIYMADLALWSVVIAWIFERSGRSIAVAIAMHAGGHLDNVSRAPETEVRLRILRFLVLAVVAALAAGSLAANPEARHARQTRPLRA